MTQQGIYISPDNIVPNRDRGDKQNLYLYVCKYDIAYGNGMVLVAARNPMRAMEILEATNRKMIMDIQCIRLCEKCYNMRNY
jgi:hypothetical protein